MQPVVIIGARNGKVVADGVHAMVALFERFSAKAKTRS
jgi:hypothetical protein